MGRVDSISSSGEGKVFLNLKTGKDQPELNLNSKSSSCVSAMCCQATSVSIVSSCFTVSTMD